MAVSAALSRVLSVTFQMAQRHINQRCAHLVTLRNLLYPCGNKFHEENAMTRKVGSLAFNLRHRGNNVADGLKGGQLGCASAVTK